MKLGPIIHGGLLVVALGVAYKGWTKEETSKPSVGTVEVWSHDPATFTGIAYDAERKSVKATWRSEGADRYLWGEVARVSPKARKPKEGEEAKPEEKDEDQETTSREFPVDADTGEEMVANFAQLKALTALGKLDDAKSKEYGLSDSKESLSVSFKDGQENLIVGARVYGGSDRYVLHAESGKAYVLSSSVLRPLDAGETSLRLKKMHGYDAEHLAKVAVDSEGAKKDMVKTEVTDEKGAHEAWASADAPTKADLTLDSFLDRADKLSPIEYLAEDPQAAKIVRLSYQDKAGKEIGFLEFFRKVPPELERRDDGAVPDALKAEDKKEKPPEIEYYIRTERTRIWGKVSRLAAERFDQDVANLFGREAPPTTPTPEPPPGPPPGAPGPHGAPAPGPHGAPAPGPHGMSPAPGKPAAPPAPKPAGAAPPAGKPATAKPPAAKPSAPPASKPATKPTP